MSEVEASEASEPTSTCTARLVAGVLLEPDAHGRLVAEDGRVFWLDRVSLPGVERVRWSSAWGDDGAGRELGTHGVAPTLREAVEASQRVSR